MSDAILTFQVQLSGVMETVLKSAMYEITRLVEDSFLEEVSRSKQEVESLRQRLQWSESRRREREGGGGRSRCADCGRAAVSSEDAEDRASGPQSGVDEGRGLKQEKVPEGSWSSCPGEVATSNPGPARSAPEDLAPPSPVRASENSAAAPTGLEGGRPDSLLKEEEGEDDEDEEEEPQEMDTGDDIQGTWLPCSEGGVGASALCERLGEQEWSPGTRQDTAPPSGRLPPEQHNAGETYGLYVPETESVAHGLLLAVEQRRNDPDSEPEPWTRRNGHVFGRDAHERALQAGSNFTQESEDPEGPPAGAKPQPNGERPSPSRPRDAKPGVYLDGLAIKQEGEGQPDWAERAVLEDPYARQNREDREGTETQAHANRGELSPGDATSRPGEQGCGSLGKRTQVRAIDRTAVTHSPAAADKGAWASYDKALFASRNVHAHPRALGGDRRHGGAPHFGKGVTQTVNLRSLLRQNADRAQHSCTQCGKTFSHFCHLKAHQQTHTGERPFCCTLCGRSFTKLSNLKAHRRVHTGERPYICTECGKRFTQKCNLKRHQRIHTGERLFSCT